MNTSIQDPPRPLSDHLNELRSRLGWALGAVAAAALLIYPFTGRVISSLAAGTGGFVFTHITEAFWIRLQLAGWLGLFSAMPVVLYEAWRFVGVAFEVSFQRRVVALLPVSYALFCGGAAMAWWGVRPAATRFLLGYATADLRPLLSIQEYVSFAGWMVLGFGLLFQLPLVILFLVAIGVVHPDSLSYYRRHALVGLAIVCAMLTPGPDIVSQLALLVPSYGLYEISIWVGRLWLKRSELQRSGVMNSGA